MHIVHEVSAVDKTNILQSYVKVCYFDVVCFNSYEVINYLHQVNVVNGGDNVFTGILSVCVCACAQRRDVIRTMTSLRHQEIVYCL